jgi:hypothetical protein
MPSGTRIQSIRGASSPSGSVFLSTHGSPVRLKFPYAPILPATYSSSVYVGRWIQEVYSLFSLHTISISCQIFRLFLMSSTIELIHLDLGRPTRVSNSNFKDLLGTVTWSDHCNPSSSRSINKPCTSSCSRVLPAVTMKCT